MGLPTRRINYDYAKKQVEKIRNLSKDTSDIAKELDGVISQTSKVWSGDAAKNFLEQCSFIKEDIQTTARDISALADRVSSTADSINREDNERIRRYYESLKQQSINSNNN